MSRPQPSPEAMRAAEAICEDIGSVLGRDLSHTFSEGTARRIDAAFRPLRESHERMRVACENAYKPWKEFRHLDAREVEDCPDELKEIQAALAQVPR